MNDQGSADDEAGSLANPPMVSRLILSIGRRSRGWLGRDLAGLGLHPGQDLVIQLLGDATLSQRELADRMHVEPPTITRMVQRLETAGIVERSADLRDARVSRVRLTPQGQALRDPVERIRTELEAHTINGLSDDELAQLRALLTKVLDNLAPNNTRYSCATVHPSSSGKESSWLPALNSVNTAMPCPGPPSPSAPDSRS